MDNTGTINKIILFLQNIYYKFNAFLNSKLGSITKIVVSIAILLYFVLIIDIHQIRKSLSNFNFNYFLFLLFIINIRVFLGGIRFYYLLSPFQKISPLLLTKHYYIGFMFNNLLPTVVGGDAARIILLSQNGSISKKRGFSLVFLERLIGLYCLLTFSFIFSFFINVPIKLALISGILFTIATLTIVFHNKILTLFDKYNFIRKIKTLVKDIKASKTRLLKIILFSFIFQFTSILLNYLVALAFEFEISLLPFLVFVPFIWLFTMIPISFGGVGLREMAFIYLFSTIGLAKEQSFILSLGTYITFLFTGLIGGMIFFKDNVVYKTFKQIKDIKK